MDGPELLQIGAEGTPRRSGKLRMTVLVVVGVLAAAGFLVDHAVRVHEQGRVSACAEKVATAVDLAGRPVHAAYEYIRPVLANGPHGSQENALYLLVANAARDPDADLAAATSTCEKVSVLPWHDSLLHRQDHCLDVLERQRTALQAVAGDGKAVLALMKAPRRC